MQTQPESPLPSPIPSDLEPLEWGGYTFQWERLRAIAPELPPLFKEHWRELAVNKKTVPLAPDWDRYFAADLVGQLLIQTVRVKGVLVGYMFNFVGPHLHYSQTYWCAVDMYYLDPVYRTGWAGVKMFVYNERRLRAIGVKIISAVEKLHFHNDNNRRVAVLMKRLGYKRVEVAYQKTL